MALCAVRKRSAIACSNGKQWNFLSGRNSTGTSTFFQTFSDASIPWSALALKARTSSPFDKPRTGKNEEFCIISSCSSHASGCEISELQWSLLH
jgi:hypothetical protein